MVVAIFYYFRSYLGKMNPILTHIFQRGWFNHQLVMYVKVLIRLVVALVFWETKFSLHFACMKHQETLWTMCTATAPFALKRNNCVRSPHKPAELKKPVPPMHSVDGRNPAPPGMYRTLWTPYVYIYTYTLYICIDCTNMKYTLYTIEMKTSRRRP